MDEIAGQARNDGKKRKCCRIVGNARKRTSTRQATRQVTQQATPQVAKIQPIPLSQ